MTIFEKIGSIGKITLNRPEVYHSVNNQMAKELHNHLDRCKDDDIRVVYLTANGKAFCAGQDLKETMGGNIVEIIGDAVENNYNPLVRRIHELEKPVVCAVNGMAVGAGANLALACDLVVAKESSVFIQAFSKIGLIPDTGGTFILPRLVGFKRALGLAMLADKVDGKEAERMGMIYKAFSDETFEEESWKLAERLATMPTKALALTKQAFNASLTNDINAQLAVEKDLQIKAGQTEDFAEGVMAFIQKRKPDFKGK